MSLLSTSQSAPRVRGSFRGDASSIVDALTAMAPKGKGGNPMATQWEGHHEVDDDEMLEHRKRLWKVKLSSRRENRLARINDSRRHKQSSEDTNRDRVAKHDAIELAQEAFSRYFDCEKNEFDMHFTLEALGDFGLKARTRPEKLELRNVLLEYQDNTAFMFDDFLSIIEEGRLRMRGARAPSIFQAWRTLNVTTGADTIDQSDVTKLIDALGLGPQGPMERAVSEAMVGRLRLEVDGMVALGEVEFLIQQVAEHMQASRRSLERVIQQKKKIGPAIISEFRSQLIELHEAFDALDEDRTGTLEGSHILDLLAEFGYISGNAENKSLTAKRIEEVLSQMGAKDMPFQHFLVLIHTLRETDMSERADDVQALFNSYDRDRSGALEMREICLILTELDLYPQTPLEQTTISQLIEEVDEDGSGMMELDELTMMIQRISEGKFKLQRSAEDEKAQALSFTKAQTSELRAAFETLDNDFSGTLGLSEIQRAMHVMQWRVSDVKLQKFMTEVDEDGSGALNFLEFLVLMRHVDDDLTSQNREANPDPGERGGAERHEAKGEVRVEAPPGEDKRATGLVGRRRAPIANVRASTNVAARRRRGHIPAGENTEGTAQGGASSPQLKM